MMIVMGDWPARSVEDDGSFVLLDEGAVGEGSGRRPLTGFVVIALAVIAIAAVAVGRGRTVSGAAVVPPPPQIGDCVPTSAAEKVWQEMNGVDVPALVSTPCTGVRAGEVVSVDDQRVYEQTDCGTPASAYLGLPAFPEVTGPETVWAARSVAMSYTFGPSPLQVAAGQHWSACAVFGLSRESFRSQPLAGSPRDAATRGGAAFDPFATCAEELLSDEFTPCGEPHRYEIVADALALGSDEFDSLASCRATVTALTGLADPSAGGRLRVELVAYVWDDGAATARVTGYQQARAGNGSAMCTVSPSVAGETLTSTLVGLGERSIPIR